MHKKKLLRVLLVHGTWSTGKRWREDNSPFWAMLQRRLLESYESVEPITVEWPGLNRWGTRERAVLDVKDRLAALCQGDGARADYLLIGHSYGGNVATEAARERMQASDDFEPLGVICLNTPFLKQEPRASAAFLKVWMFLCLLMLAAVVVSRSWFAPIAHAADAIAPSLFGVPMTAPLIGGTAIVLAVVLLTAVLRNRQLLRERQALLAVERQAAPERHQRVPRVLCLTSADDEAIAALSVWEGLANLAQFLLHPLALVFAVGIGAAWVFLPENVAFCPRDVHCWATGAIATGSALLVWLTAAIIFSVASSLLVSLAFGKNWTHVLEASVSRVLVSYVPLQPANASFRGVVDTDVPWWSIKLFHSRIDNSPAAVECAVDWLIPIFLGTLTRRTPRAREPLAVIRRH